MVLYIPHIFKTDLTTHLSHSLRRFSATDSPAFQGTELLPHYREVIPAFHSHVYCNTNARAR